MKSYEVRLYMRAETDTDAQELIESSLSQETTVEIKEIKELDCYCMEGELSDGTHYGEICFKCRNKWGNVNE